MTGKSILAVHDVAYRKKAVHKLLNRAPQFWNTCLALQASAFIALGRVFDSNSPHNINQLLKVAQSNRTQLFSKAALCRRKQGSKPQPPEWLPDFLRSAHEPLGLRNSNLFSLCTRRRFQFQLFRDWGRDDAPTFPSGSPVVKEKVWAVASFAIRTTEAIIAAQPNTFRTCA